MAVLRVDNHPIACQPLRGIQANSFGGSLGCLAGPC